MPDADAPSAPPPPTPPPPGGSAVDHARVKDLFNELAELSDAGAREARLAAADVTPVLAARVRSLLAHATTATRFGRPVAGMLASAAGPEVAPGDRLGAWTLVSVIGQGGMGEVYLAERSDGHYRQRAAIKLLLGLPDAAALAQLAAERQILADLAHPNIARLIDGGTTPLGRPYLVMEYIEGRRIDDYAQERGLGIEPLFELCHQVCDAVAYAHRQLVVHCDIKPGNVLVGADGRAMLLDFGIAQLEGGQGAGTLALTPKYASPEQLAGKAPTAASDIYSLGRMIEELLAAVQPPPPRADEWRAIVARACAADPEQRYGSVGALQSDLRRFRAQLPLAALPRRPAYLARKFVRRRWPWVLAGCGVLLLSAGFVLRLVAERDRARQAERLAREEAATAQQVSDFLVGLYKDADPHASGRADLSASALADKGRARMDAQLQGQGVVLAELKFVLGKVYENMGRTDTAIELYTQAVRIERAQSPPRPQRLAALVARLANALANARQAARAVPLAREAVALTEADPAPGADDLADNLNVLGWALTEQGDYVAAEPILRRSLALREAREREAPLELASSANNLGLLLRRAGRPREGEAQLRRALSLKEAALGPDNPLVNLARLKVAQALADEFDYAAAAAILVPVVATERRIFGPDNPRVASALNELGLALDAQGRGLQAIATLRQALAVDEAAGAHRSLERAAHLASLGSVLENAGDPGAEAVLRESLALRQALLPAGNLSVASAEYRLGRWLLRAGRPAEARPRLAAAQTARDSQLPAGHADRRDVDLALAELALAEGRAVAAAPLLDGPLPDGLDPLRQAEWLRVQALLADARGRPEAARGLRRQAYEAALHAGGAEHPETRRLRLALGSAPA